MLHVCYFADLLKNIHSMVKNLHCHLQYSPGTVLHVLVVASNWLAVVPGLVSILM